MAPEFSAQVVALAGALGLPQAGEAGFALQLGPGGLQLQELGEGASGPVRVDFLEGAVAHRRQHGGGAGQLIAKAVGIQPGVRPMILDATAGLGRDAFVLAQLGCQVTLMERHPLVGALLADGLARALLDPEVGPIIQRMHFLRGNAIELMKAWTDEPPQVIYLDPMFPHRDKTSLVKKEMRVFRPLVGDDNDATVLLEGALALATHRVVVKRPRKAPGIGGKSPGYVLEGKSSRYDIYPKRALKPRE
jgi:16S rRNA (guanine1516-N2)-methyltransferase